MRISLLSKLVLLTSIASGNALAFEVNNFRSGMDREAALSLLRQRWDHVAEVQGNVGPEQTFLATMRGGNASAAITTCRERLTAYQHDVAGGIRAFARMVQFEQANSGTGNGEAQSRETSSGEWSQITFKWEKGSYRKEIGYSLLSSEQVFVLYTVGGRCQ